MTGKLDLPELDKLGPVDFSAFPYTGAEDHIAKLTHQIQLDLARAREDGLRAGLAAQGHGLLVAEIDRLRAILRRISEAWEIYHTWNPEEEPGADAVGMWASVAEAVDAAKEFGK